MQSTNTHCNAFQASVGIFLHTSNTGTLVTEFLSKIGVSTSPKAIELGILNLSKTRDRAARAAGQTGRYMWAFDNLDIAFAPATATAETDLDTLAHLTTATMPSLHPSITVEDLDCAAEVWERSAYFNPAIHSASSAGSSCNPAVTPQSNPPVSSLQSPSPDLPQTDLPPSAQSNQTSPKQKIGMEQLLAIHQEPEAPPNGLLRRDRFNAFKFLSDLVEYGPQYFQTFRGKLTEPEIVDAIPLTTSKQVPLHAMDISPSTPAANGDVLGNIFSQAGVGTDPGQCDPKNRAMLVSGDLLTGERLRSLMHSRSEESSKWRRLENIVFVMGLFHFKMACADAIWRIFIQPKSAGDDPNSLLEQVGQIRPKETGKTKTSPGFRRMHEIIQHVGICLRLESWVARVKQDGFTSLEDWAEKKRPDLEELIALSEELARTFVGSAQGIAKARRGISETRDQHFENMLLQQQMFLLYEESSYAMNMGDIGRVETCFLPWAFVFQASGKHKYANELIRYLKNVFFIYPPGLSRAVRYSILVNPTGKRGKWRGIDWVVEHNNLYIKVSILSTALTRSVLSDIYVRRFTAEDSPIATRGASSLSPR